MIIISKTWIGKQIMRHRLVNSRAAANNTRNLKGKFFTPEQKGWGCELIAVAGVMRWLYENNAIKTKPLPARKRDDKKATDSLRSIAKRKYGTQIGEIVDPKTLIDIARHNEEIVAICLECNEEQDYRATLMAAIDNNLAPIVYFDVGVRDKENGMPIKAKGRNYHAAIVTGYSTNGGELEFTLLQWQKAFKVKASDLFASTSQMLDSPSFAEPYVKVKTRENEGAWFPKRLINDYFKDVPIIIKESLPIQHGLNGGLRNKIFIIDSVHRTKSLILQLDQQLKDLKKDNSQLARNKTKALEGLKHALINNANRETLQMLITQWQSQTSRYRGMTNLDLICKQRYDGWFGFLFNPARTTSLRIIEDSLQNLPNATKLK